MADTVTSQTITDVAGTKTVMKFTNKSDGTGETLVNKVDASELNHASSTTKIARVIYSVNTTDPKGSVEIVFDGSTNATALFLSGQGTIDLQTSAIKSIDPNTLVTVGAWSEHSSTNVILKNDGNKFFNYWSDECLIKSGQKENGILDFNQIHTYANSITGKSSIFFIPGATV